jgi:type I restriction enzyme S subunit
MAGEWREFCIEDIAEVIGGGTPSTKDEENFNGAIPWVTPKDLSGHFFRYISCGERNLSEKGLGNSSARLLPQNAVLLTTRAPVGYVAIASNPIATNQGFRSLVVREGFFHEFVYYLLKANTERLKSHATGTTFGELSGSTLKRMQFLFPPEAEQRAIAHILGTLDDKIELNRKMNETLEAIARAIFKSWFIDFDPVRAKAEGRDPGLPKEIADLFPDSFEDSELGKIPRGWRVKRLGEICKKPQYGFTASAKEEVVGPKFLRITDINKLPWIEWATVPYCEISSDDYEKYKLQIGDFLIARMADPGHGVFIEEDAEAVFASYLIRFRPVDLRYGRYLQYWQRSSSFWNLINARKAGTTRFSLNAQDLSGFPLLIPSFPILESFTALIAPLRQRVVHNVKESRTLAAIRDALLPKLISGEIRVKDAERFLKGRGL